jgi:metal-responsive CopG/Arc/MetJ family transcriptional regulator
MRAKSDTRIVQVPMPVSLVASMDLLSQERGESRATLILEACAEYIANAREAEMDRQYIESTAGHANGQNGASETGGHAGVWEDDWVE